MSLLLISHDLSVIAEMADRRGRDVRRRGRRARRRRRDAHRNHSIPYTEALLRRAARRRTARATRWLRSPAWSPTPTPCRPAAGSAPDAATSSTACALEHPALDQVLSEPRVTLPAGRGARAGRRRRHQCSSNDGPRREPAAPSERRDDLAASRGCSKKFSLRSTKVFGRKSAVDRGRRRELHAALPARPSASSARAAPASPPSAASCWVSCVRRRVRSSSGGQQIARGFGRRRDLRRDVQVVFQNPYASLDPMMTIEQTLSEPLEVHLQTRSSRPPTQSARAARAGRSRPASTRTAIRMRSRAVSGNASQSPAHLR